jgi:phage repressor protein C with HTH and peptisase S24 domain
MTSLARETIVDLLARGITVRFQAHGDSMYPLIRSGDYLVVAPVELARVSVGEIVLTLTARGLTAHRVMTIDGATLTTRGDNSLTADAAIAAPQLLGRVVAIERNGRSLAPGGAMKAAVIRALRKLRRRMAG